MFKTASVNLLSKSRRTVHVKKPKATEDRDKFATSMLQCASCLDKKLLSTNKRFRLSPLISNQDSSKKKEDDKKLL